MPYTTHTYNVFEGLDYVDRLDMADWIEEDVDHDVSACGASIVGLPDHIIWDNRRDRCDIEAIGRAMLRYVGRGACRRSVVR